MEVHHRMPKRHLTPRQPPPDISTSQKWKPDPEVSVRHDDLYARACECDYERLIFDAKYDNATPPNSPASVKQSDLSTEETWKTPGTARERSRETFPQTEESCDLTDTYSFIEPDVETNSEQPNKIPTNPRGSKYNLRHNPKPNCNDDYID